MIRLAIIYKLADRYFDFEERLNLGDEIGEHYKYDFDFERMFEENNKMVKKNPSYSRELENVQKQRLLKLFE